MASAHTTVRMNREVIVASVLQDISWTKMDIAVQMWMSVWHKVGLVHMVVLTHRDLINAPAGLDTSCTSTAPPVWTLMNVNCRTEAALTPAPTLLEDTPATAHLRFYCMQTASVALM